MSNIGAPYFRMTIGSYAYSSNPPTNFQSVEYTRKGDAANEFTITLIYFPNGADPSTLENRIIKSNRKITFQYGWQGGKKSPTIQGMITNYNLEYVAEALVLTITGVSSMTSSTSTVYTKTFVSSKPSEIVRELASMEKWKIGKVEETKVAHDSSGRPKVYTMQSQSALNFITQVLIPDAESLSGKKDFSFSLNDSDKKIYFQSLSSATSGGATSSTVFDWYSPRNFGILSFNMDFSGAAMMATTTTQETVVTYWLDANGGKHDTKAQAQAANAAMGLASVPPTSHSETVTTTSETSGSDIYEGSITIRGDPSAIQILSTKFRITPYIKGKKHHTAGIFVVKSATDTIQGGTYTTTYNLLRQGDGNA